MTEVAKLTPLEEKRRKQIEEKEQAEVVLDAHVPKPVGYRVLIVLPTIEDTFEGGIAKASSTIREETILTMVGVVVHLVVVARAATVVGIQKIIRYFLNWGKNASIWVKHTQKRGKIALERCRFQCDFWRENSNTVDCLFNAPSNDTFWLIF